MLTDSGRLKNIGALVSSSGLSIWAFAGVGLGVGVGELVGSGVGVGSVVSVVTVFGGISVLPMLPPGILQAVNVDMETAAARETAAQNLNVLRIFVLIISIPRT